MPAVDKSIKEISPNFKIRSVSVFNAEIKQSSDRIKEYIKSGLDKISEVFKCREDIYNDEIIQGLRTLYKSWKIDPSRYRPSPERILRKLTSGKDFSFINNIVDIANIVSVSYRIPVSLYDLTNVKGNLIIKKCESEGTYTGITGMEIGTKDKVLIFDDIGPLGSPTTDAERAKITESTDKLIFLVYGPENVGEEYLNRMITEFSEKVEEFNIGKVSEIE